MNEEQEYEQGMRIISDFKVVFYIGEGSFFGENATGNKHEVKVGEIDLATLNG